VSAVCGTKLYIGVSAVCGTKLYIGVSAVCGTKLGTVDIDAFLRIWTDNLWWKKLVIASYGESSLAQCGNCVL
jgi:hypothetical protein